MKGFNLISKPGSNDAGLPEFDVQAVLEAGEIGACQINDLGGVVAESVRVLPV